METKICNRCGATKVVDEFNWRWKVRQIRHNTCRECQKAQKNRWYQQNKMKHKANMYENRLKKMAAGREFIWQYLLTHPCIDCGEADPRVLEFDHVAGTKRTSVTRLVRNGFSTAIIQSEIEKCVVRCANCHKKRTYRDSWRARKLQEADN